MKDSSKRVIVVIGQCRCPLFYYGQTFHCIRLAQNLPVMKKENCWFWSSWEVQNKKHSLHSFTHSLSRQWLTTIYDAQIIEEKISKHKSGGLFSEKSQSQRAMAFTVPRTTKLCLRKAFKWNDQFLNLKNLQKGLSGALHPINLYNYYVSI